MPGSMKSSHTGSWLLAMPPVEWAVQQVRELLLAAVRQGPVPQHVAFIMDGNRRFAKANGIEVVEGHSMGFEALARILEVCYKIGVKVVTIYAFSIENFKRSKYEVDALMDMARFRISQLAQHGELLERYGARLQLLGERSLLRQDVIDAADRAMAMTAHNKRAVLNICASYTSRDEITTAIRTTVSDFSHPLRPRLKRPFSESRIARTIRAQQLATVSEQEDAKTGASKEEYFGHESFKSGSDNAFNRFAEIIAKYSSDSADENQTHKEADEVLALLQNESAATNEKLAGVNGVLSIDVSSADFAELQSLALSLTDFDAAPSALGSTSSTLNPSTKSSETQNHLNNFPDPEAITADTITANTFTGSQTPPLDLLIRTSGVDRLSDFMLWQCHQETEIVFLKCLWPEFNLSKFIPVLLEWQWRRKKAVKVDDTTVQAGVKMA